MSDLREAISIIEAADRRAEAADGPVLHVRDTMTDGEWRRLYLALKRAEARSEGLDALREAVEFAAREFKRLGRENSHRQMVEALSQHKEPSRE